MTGFERKASQCDFTLATCPGALCARSAAVVSVLSHQQKFLLLKELFEPVLAVDSVAMADAGCYEVCVEGQ